MPRIIRVYVPTTLSALAGSWPKGEAADVTAPVFTVTDQHRQESGEAHDEEELEFDAMCRAADVAAEFVDGVEGDRGLVVAADIAADDAEEPAGGAGLGGGLDADLRLKAALPAEKVVSFHIDEDLLWYDVTEAKDLIAEL